MSGETPSFPQRAQQSGRRLEELPAPDPAAAAHSEALAAHIRAEMTASGGRLPFRRFMELALYAPGLGYYSAGAHKLGAGGDFVTAPEISPLFARTLARPCRAVLEELGAGGEILEVGAGTGAMAATLLTELAGQGALPPRYHILELSADLRARQEETLRRADPALLQRVVWRSDLPGAFRGVILANELLDAMPVHRFVITAAGPQEFYVGWEDAGFVWQTGPLSEPRLAARLSEVRARVGALGEGYTSEINLAAEDWVRTAAAQLERGLILLFDYGYPRHEYYHPQRGAGTLTCYYRHRAHDDPLVRVGLQDITSHVDFTAMAEAGHSGGLDVLGYTTQAHFLLGSGIGELAAEVDPTDPAYLAQLNQLRRLTLPHEMGEVVKVLALGRGVRVQLPGLLGRDLRDRL